MRRFHLLAGVLVLAFALAAVEGQPHEAGQPRFESGRR
jgi:hypothetical protein